MKTKLVLIAILILASFLRLYKLSSIPPHLTPDEAALGYNAFSILKTGKDEWGTKFPIIFKSFGDNKPGLYIYTDVPFVAVLGLNDFSVRLPSALAGVFAIYLIYLIVNLLFENLGLTASFLLAISPWHIFFSRGAWEANLSLTLTLIGIYFFLKSLKNQSYILVSAVFFSLTLITYQGAKVSSAVVLILLLTVYYKKILRYKKNILVSSLLIGFLISIPVLTSLNKQTGRAEVFSIFSYPRSRDFLQNFLSQGNEKIGSLQYYLFHSESLNFTRGILGRWFNHFSGKFLFFDGDYSNLRHSSPYQGVMLLSDVLFLPLGLFLILKNKITRSHFFIILWIIFAPLPAILTRDQVHAIRSLNMVIPLTIITSFGVYFLIQQRLIFKLLLFLYIPSLIYFLESYFIELPHLRSQNWFYGYRQAIEFITPIQNNFDKIYFQKSYNQPYIYFLFYNAVDNQKYDPKKYQEKSKFTKGENINDVGTVENIDNIYFTELNWQIYSQEKNVLIVDDSNVHIPSDVQTKDIKYLDNIFTSIRIYQTPK